MQIGIPYSTYVSPALAVRAGAPGPLTATISHRVLTVGLLVDSTLSADTVTVEIAVGQYRSPTTVATGGVAFDPLTAGTDTVFASITGFTSTPLASIEVTVSTPGMTLPSAANSTTASGLQRSQGGTLGAAEHGGVDVVIRSSNPAVLLISPDAVTPGTDSIVVSVPDGSTYFPYYIQGVEDTTGTVAVTATAAGFTDGTTSGAVVQPGVYIGSLPSSVTTDAEPAFYVIIGIPYSTYVSPALAVRAGAPGPLIVTLASSNVSIGQLVTSRLTGGTVTVQIAEGLNTSPTNVANGGVAFDGLIAGSTTVTASIPRFITAPLGSQTVTVTTP